MHDLADDGHSLAPAMSRALRQSPSRDDLLDWLPLAAYACDRDGLILQYNQRAAGLWGRSPAVGDAQCRFCGAYKTYLPGGGLLPPAEQPMAEVLRTGVPVHDRELILERPDGSRITVTANVNPLFDEQHRVIGGVSCFQDVTERRDAEKAVRDGERRTRELLEALPAAVYMTDAAGRLTFFNRAAVELVGRRPELGTDSWCVSWRLYNVDGTVLPHDECPMAIALKEQRPVRDVEAIAERPDGTRVQFKPYPTPLFDENGRLTGAINMLVDVTEVRRSEAAAMHLAAIVSSSDDAIISKTLDGKITSWNAGAERIFGYQADEMIGQSITRIIPPELHGEEERILAQLRAGERIDHYDTTRVAKDGRRVDISLTVSPLRDRTGRVIGASKVARDITERKAAEARQGALVDELNHRVKNTLATVQALAARTIDRPEIPEDVRDTFEGRLFALSRTHDQLSRGRWESADFAAVLDGIFEPYRQRAGERIRLTGPHVNLAPRASLALAMVLHELATNAAKYGSLSVPTGALAVSWTVAADHGRRRLTIDWQETGGPPVRRPERQGFGSRLLERSIAHELKGSTEISFEPAGVRCRIAVPLASVER
jgi:PAS domain S-box-containing protein